MTIKPLLLLSAALLQGVAAGAAHAGSDTGGSAYASISNFRFTLTDANLNDGITPALSWNTSGNGEISYSYWRGDTYQGDAKYPFNTPFAGTVGYQGPVDGAQLASRAAVTGNSLETLAVQSSTAVQAFTGGSSSASSTAHATPLNIKITPNTGLAITFDITVGSTLNSSDVHDNVYSYASADVGNQTFSLWHNLSGNPDQDPSGRARTQTYTLHQTSGANGAELYFKLDTHSSVYLTSPVPEPETAGMLLAGLGVLGAFLRRARPAPRRA